MKINVNELNEGEEVTIEEEDIEDIYEYEPCGHEINGKIRVLKALNEGGYNSTIICVECLKKYIN